MSELSVKNHSEKNLLRSKSAERSRIIRNVSEQKAAAPSVSVRLAAEITPDMERVVSQRVQEIIKNHRATSYASIPKQELIANNKLL